MLSAKDKRFTVLDSLRGLAALTVVLWHLTLTLLDAPDGSPYGVGAKLVGLIRISPLYPLIAGREAVIIFFILSGFVLSLPWVRNRKPPYGPFLLKRVCRIYIPYITTVALTFLAYTLLSGQVVPELGVWFNTPWQRDPSRAEIFQHLLLIGSFEHEQYSIVIWSLVHEMRVSIIFPLLMFFVMRWRWPVSLGVFFGLSTLGSYLSTTLAQGTDYAATLHYLVLFIGGALIAKHHSKLLLLWQQQPRWVYVVLLAAAALLYTYARVLSSFWDAASLARDAEDLLVGLGASVLIIWLLASRSAQHFMERKPLIFLGRISYSLYLVHLLVLFSLIRLLSPQVNIYLLLVAVLPLSIGAAYLSYRFVELPSIRLGRYLTGSNKKLKRSPSPPMLT